MALDTQRARHGPRRLDLARVPLAVSDCQREETEAIFPRNRRSRVRVEPAAQQHYRGRS